MSKAKVLFAALAATSMSGAAFAADLPSRRVAPAYVAPAPMFTWTGFYVGLNGGYGWGASNTIDTLVGNYQATPNLAFGPASAALGSGAAALGSNGAVLLGGQVGYNWQFGSLVYGLEADIDGAIGGRQSGAFSNGATNVGGAIGWNILSASSGSRKLDYLATVRARLGYTVMPSLLIYGTGGIAIGGTSLSGGVNQIVPIQPPAYFSAGAASSTRIGWTLGAGAEWMFASNWSAKLEYAYYDLGRASVSHPGGLVNIGSIPGVVWYSSAANTSTRFNGHIVRAGLNYHFNWGAGPVVAKY